MKKLDAPDPLTATFPVRFCHLGNISWRLGQRVPGSTQPDVLSWHEEIRAKSWQVITSTLKGTLGLHITKTSYQLGKELVYDEKAEKIRR